MNNKGEQEEGEKMRRVINWVLDINTTL